MNSSRSLFALEMIRQGHEKQKNLPPKNKQEKQKQCDFTLIEIQGFVEAVEKMRCFI